MTQRLDVKVRGPLAPLASGFEQELRQQGYRKRWVAEHVRLLAHLSRWLEDEAVEPAGVTPEQLEAFVTARRSEGYTTGLTPKALAPMLRFLREQEVVPRAASSTPATDEERLLCRYHDYLVDERGLVEAVVAQFNHVARLFVTELGDSQGFDPATLDAAVVTGFVAAQLPHHGVASAKNLATALRSFLRFLHVEGSIEAPLVQAVPRVAGWKGTSLPRGMTPAGLALLLGSCDRRTGKGRRDYAILVLLARLGLRAGEVAHLQLDDIDWRAGEVVVHGKGRRQERLPLPVDVGEAVAGYLQQGRPRSQRREVFLRAKAPIEGLSTQGIDGVVYYACDRAGLPRVGAHRLRHTAATEMLRAGATLVEVGQVLRHARPDTTAGYAKVDHARLVELALSWPGGAR